MFIDVHCHLDLLENISSAVKKARKVGVKIIVINGVDFNTNRKALALAQEFPEIKSALGIYPINGLKMEEKEIEAEIAFIKKNNENIVAIGEVGLDLKELNSLDKQSQIFQSMIELALKLDVPVIVHSRKAELQCIEMLEQLKAKKVVMHCFCGKLSLVKRIMNNGWSLSIPASVKHSTHFQSVVKIVPLTQLLCETDSPYLHPEKQFPNEPANVVASYKKIAELKNLEIEEVKNGIFKNYQKLFSHYQ